MKKYKLIEHTADVGIEVRGRNLKELFKNAGEAMFDIIAAKPAQKIERSKSILIKQKADNIEELLIVWLNELLSLSAIHELFFDYFKINKLGENTLDAAVRGSAIKNYQPHREIKAATYHELKVKKTKSGWQAQVIFDV